MSERINSSAMPVAEWGQAGRRLLWTHASSLDQKLILFHAKGEPALWESCWPHKFWLDISATVLRSIFISWHIEMTMMFLKAAFSFGKHIFFSQVTATVCWPRAGPWQIKETNRRAMEDNGGHVDMCQIYTQLRRHWNPKPRNACWRHRKKREEKEKNREQQRKRKQRKANVEKWKQCAKTERESGAVIHCLVFFKKSAARIASKANGVSASISNQLSWFTSVPEPNIDS